MSMHSMNEINAMKRIIEEARGEIWAEDMNGTRYDLKNELSQYIVFGAMLKGSRDEYELFASDANDEIALINFFRSLRKAS